MDSVPPVPPVPPTTPDVQIVPPAPHQPKLPFNLKAVLPVIAMVAALPFLAKSVFIRQLMGSRAAYPNTYCVATFGCPTPTPATAVETCPVANNYVQKTEYYGQVSLNGTPVSVGSTVKAYSPRGELVGCQTVTTTQGEYPFMGVYGKQASTPPNLPGMLDGEIVSFKVNSIHANATRDIVWHDQGSTRVDLRLSSCPNSYGCNPPTPTARQTTTVTPAPPTPTTRIVPTNTPRITPVVTSVQLPTSTPVVIPTPVQNVAPRFTSPGLMGYVVTVGKPFSTSITGRDANPNDVLTMTAQGLPPGIRLGPCAKPFGTSVNQLTCTIQGTPTATGLFRATVTLSDNRGGVARASVYILSWRLTRGSGSVPIPGLPLN